MAWHLGGILLWLSGWWLTGRLFPVYNKAIYIEELEERKHGGPGPSSSLHTGTTLFMLFDLGLLLLGIRSADALIESMTGKDVGDHLAAHAINWSVAVCVFLYRQGVNLHRFYYDRWRVRSGHHALRGQAAGTWIGLWRQTPTPARVVFATAPLLALIPLIELFWGRLALGPDPAAHLGFSQGFGRFLKWFLLPQVLVLAALASPLRKIRRLAEESTGG